MGLDAAHRQNGYVIVYLSRNCEIAGTKTKAEGWKSVALGGWEVSGVLTLPSGLPFTPVDSAGGSAYALSSPNLATPAFAPGRSCGNAAMHGGSESRLAHWVDPTAYIGPPQQNIDFTVGKMFRLTERQNLRFQAEFFNFFNHPSFANPSATDIESASSFSQITSVVGTPRLIPFSLKYLF